MSANPRRLSEGHDRFLFVNKDASTIRVREKDLKLETAIQSHVQRHMHRKSFAESLITSSILREEGIEAGEFGDSGLSPWAPASQHGPARFLDLSNISATFSDQDEQTQRSASPATAKDSNQIGYITGSAPVSRRTGTSTTPIGLSQPSPLHSMPEVQYLSDKSLLLRRAAPVLLNYWKTVVLPERFFFDTRCTPLSRTRHAHAIAAENHGAATRYARLCSLLASTATHMLVRDSGVLVPHLDSHEQTQLPLTLKTMAIEAIRRELSQGQLDKELLHDVQHLWAASDLNDICGGANMHHKALSDMIKTFGGLEDIDDYFLETHLKLHWYGSLARLESPPADLLDLNCFRKLSHAHEVHPIDIELPQLISVGLGRQTWCGTLLNHAKSLFYLTSITRLFEAQQTYDADRAKYSCYRHLAIGYQLLRLRYEKPELEALRIALIYYTAMVQSERFDIRCASRSLHHLRSALEPTLVSHNMTWEDQIEWLLWTAVMGGLTANENQSVAWFATVVSNVTAHLNIKSFTSLEKGLSGVLYDQALLRAPLRDFYNRHMSP